MLLAESGKPPQERRAAIAHVMTAHGLGVTRACGLIGMSRSMYRYEAMRPDDAALKVRLTALAAQKRRYGYHRLHVLLCHEG